jgi:(S)-ureidoglycine aminohydrolase
MPPWCALAMRPIQSLVHSRTRVTPRYALLPLEGFPFSRLPTWPTAQVRVLASPRMGAEFVQYLIDLPAGEQGEFPADDAVETFFYVLSGGGTFVDRGDVKMSFKAGHFGLTPPGRASHFSATQPTQLLVLRKNYEPTSGHERGTMHYGHESDVKPEVWAGDEGALLQTLIPDDFKFDLAMNIFEFAPGHGLPIVETHVMEHGALILQGKGVYFLDGEWMEVEKDDFIWMGPYCPQSFYATGPTPAKYLYYKNVNREIGL